MIFSFLLVAVRTNDTNDWSIITAQNNKRHHRHRHRQASTETSSTISLTVDSDLCSNVLLLCCFHYYFKIDTWRKKNES